MSLGHDFYGGGKDVGQKCWGYLNFVLEGTFCCSGCQRVFAGKGNSTQLLLHHNDVINVNDITRAK